MGVVSHLRTSRTSEITWYLSARLDDNERLAFALSAGGAVLRGRDGRKAGHWLRNAGFSGRLWLDPALYEAPGQLPQRTLFGDEWYAFQRELDVVELISPGSWVPARDTDALAQAIEREGKWVADTDGARLSLAIHSWWLQHGLNDLIVALADLNVPVAVAFAHRYDPLSGLQAVRGLVDVLAAVDDIVVLRSDIGALGAVANGASLAAIGTSSTVRHVFPRNEKGSRRPVTSPSVFVPSLLDFKLGEFLDELPHGASPACDMPCCAGRALRRFNDLNSASDAQRHNRTAIRFVVDALLACPAERRMALFGEMCREAVVAVDDLSRRARRRIGVRPQVMAWARLASNAS